MQAPRRPDPEFDPPTAPTVRLRDFDPLEGQRLVVNPFLAAFGMIAWWEAGRWLLHSSFPPLAVAIIFPLVFLPYLVQYHCLDCGRTGTFVWRDRHACPALIARRVEARRPRLPIPSARSQLVFWVYLLGGAALLIIVAGAALASLEGTQPALTQSRGRADNRPDRQDPPRPQSRNPRRGEPRPSPPLP